MPGFGEKLVDTIAAFVEQAHAENEADRRIAKTKRDLIQLAEQHPDNWELIKALSDPPFLTLQMNVPMEQIEGVQKVLCDIYLDNKRRHGDKPMITIEGTVSLS